MHIEERQVHIEMINTNVLNHEEFCAFLQASHFDNQVRSPFALRTGEHIVPMKSIRGKETTFQEAEFLIDVGVIDDFAFEMMKCIADLVICTPAQMEMYWLQHGIFTKETIPTRNHLCRCARKLVNYQFIKVVRLACDESVIQSGYIMSMHRNGQRALWAKFQIRSHVIPYFDVEMEVHKMKKTLSTNQLVQAVFSADTPCSRNTLIQEKKGEKGIRPFALLNSSILVESVRRNDQWMEKLKTKMGYYEELLRTPNDHLNYSFASDPKLILLTEDLRQLHEVEKLFSDRKLSMSCPVYLTTDMLAYSLGRDCPFLELKPSSKKEKHMGVIRSFLRRLAS